MKVADQDVARDVFFVFEFGQVAFGLFIGFGQVFAPGFHLHQQLAGEKAVDAVDAHAAVFGHSALKVHRAQVVQPVHAAQFAHKVLRLTHFVAGISELFAEGLCPVVELVLQFLGVGRWGAGGVDGMSHLNLSIS